MGPIYGRISSGMQSASMLGHLLRANEDLFLTQQQISTGRRILTPSMDAFGASEYLRYGARAQSNQSYLSTVANLTAGYNFADSQLSEGNSVISSLKSVALRESNDGSADASSRTSSITELNALRQALLAMANAKHKGLSVFGGMNSTAQAFSTVGEALKFNGSLKVNGQYIEDGLEFASGLTADKVFGELEAVSASRVSLNAALQFQTVSPSGHPIPSTSLSSLNGGRGVDAGKITVTVYPDGAENPNGALNYEVDLRNSKTIADVAAAFNNVRGSDGESVFDATIHTSAGLGWPQSVQNLVSGLKISAAGELAGAVGTGTADIRFTNTDGRTTAADLGLVTGSLSYGVTGTEIAGPFNTTYNFQVQANGRNHTISVTPTGAQSITELASALTTQVNNGLRTLGMYEFTTAFGTDGDKLTLQVSDASGTGSFALRGLDQASIAIGDSLANGTVTTAASFSRMAGSFTDGSFAGRDLNPALTLTTALTALGGGNGLVQAKDAAGNALTFEGIRITNGSLAADINLADLLANPNATLGDLVNRINASGTQVDARISASGDRIEIASKLVGVPLRIENVNGSIASQLGVDSRFGDMRTSDLNNGAGLNLIEGADFRAITSTGVAIDFDLGNATTVDGVIKAINGSTANRLPDGSAAFSASAVAERSFSSGSLPDTAFGAGGVSPISVDVSLNGRETRTIVMQGPFATRDDLAAAFQTGINNLASQLGMSGFSATVNANNATGGLDFRVQDPAGNAQIDFFGGSTAFLGLEGTANASGVKLLNGESLAHRFKLVDNTFDPASFVPGGQQPVLQNLGESTAVSDLGLTMSLAVRLQTIGAEPPATTDLGSAFSLTVDLPRGPQLTVNVAASAGRNLSVLAADIEAALRTEITNAGVSGYNVSIRVDAGGGLLVETGDGFGDGSITFSGADAADLGIDAAQATTQSGGTPIFNFATSAFEGRTHTLRGEASDNVFTVINDLIRALESNNASAIGNTLSGFDRALERVLDARSESGSRVKRLELAQNRLERETESVADLASATMDIDLAEAASRLTRQQTMFQAGVQVSAGILRISVLDYI